MHLNTLMPFFLLILTTTVYANDNAIIPLSRHRRFAIPTLNGATFTSEFTLSFPIEDAVWPFEIFYALTYDYNTQR